MRLYLLFPLSCFYIWIICGSAWLALVRFIESTVYLLSSDADVELKATSNYFLLCQAQVISFIRLGFSGWVPGPYVPFFFCFYNRRRRDIALRHFVSEVSPISYIKDKYQALTSTIRIKEQGHLSRLITLHQYSCGWKSILDEPIPPPTAASVDPNATQQEQIYLFFYCHLFWEKKPSLTAFLVIWRTWGSPKHHHHLIYLMHLKSVIPSTSTTGYCSFRAWERIKFNWVWGDTDCNMPDRGKLVSRSRSVKHLSWESTRYLKPFIVGEVNAVSTNSLIAGWILWVWGEKKRSST